jgi:hypothetical protein
LDDVVTKWVEGMAVRAYLGVGIGRVKEWEAWFMFEAEFEDPRGRLFDGMLWQRG